tara:strand:- start:4773 stop:5144 length:372 start_codon:yes stop_codon:yes gene_type:complete
MKTLLTLYSESKVPRTPTAFTSKVVNVDWDYDDDIEMYNGTFDGKVAGEMEAWVEGDDLVCQIPFIESRDEGNGYAKQFLKELKHFFKRVDAYGVDDTSYGFWNHMRDLGLIDGIRDDGGSDL